MVSGRSRRTKTIGFRIRNEYYAILEYIARSRGIDSPHELCRQIIIAWLKARGYIK